MTSITKPDSLISDLLLGNYLWHKEKHDLPNSSDEGDIAKLHSLLPWMPSDEIVRRLTTLRKGKPGWLAAGNTIATKLATPKPIKLDINSLTKSSTNKKDSTGSDAASSDRTDRKSQDLAAWDAAVSPKITIHVCDEGKGLKQDFECPKDLLVQEMRYFADYLSSDQQKWEDVDISVHCDVNIFDWLMRYVKRKVADSNPVGSLEPTNVISILISSDFLKMENLVDLCIGYCHKNMSAILATPCNMACLSEVLVDKIANRFTDSEVDDIRDKKDKFKNVLFQKKIESLFTGPSSPARSLFRCRHCRQLLTRDSQHRLRCHPTRLCVGPRGSPVYRHEPDATFDVNEYLIEQRQQLGSWRGVYWRLWGQVNTLDCVRCGHVFACAQLGHCAYHASQARFELASTDEESASNSLGVFPCCGVKTLRFDPFRLQTGCKFRDHVIGSPFDAAAEAATSPTSTDDDQGVVVNDDRDQDGSSASGPPLSVQQILLAKRDAICVPPPPPPPPPPRQSLPVSQSDYHQAQQHYPLHHYPTPPSHTGPEDSPPQMQPPPLQPPPLQPPPVPPHKTGRLASYSSLQPQYQQLPQQQQQQQQQQHLSAGGFLTPSPDSGQDSPGQSSGTSFAATQFYFSQQQQQQQPYHHLHQQQQQQQVMQPLCYDDPRMCYALPKREVL